MPTISLSHKDLNSLVGKKLSIKQLEDAFLYVKGEIEKVEGDEIKVEIAETNRPELWSAEGIARELRGQLGLEMGLPKYNVKAPKISVSIDPGLKQIRPLTVCAVVRKMKVTEQVLLQLIQLQEKICDTYGRKRQEVAIGVYDLHKITPPIHYKAMNPNKLRFIPLEFTSEMTLNQILSDHPKGQEYGHLIAHHDKYPVFIDKAGEVLSMPPVINSAHTGRVESNTEDLFIECSGFDHKFLLPALHAMVSSLAERGGKVEAVKIKHGKKTLTTPNFKPGKITVLHDDIERMAGISLKKQEVVKLLRRARYNVTSKGKGYVCEYPSYRQDIMHPVDVIEDILISYGYNNFIPEIPLIASRGTVLPLEEFSRSMAEQLIGQGAQEIISYTLTNKDSLYRKMNRGLGRCIEITNPVSTTWSVFRTSLLPGVIEFLSKNTRAEYPQKVFEVGQVVIPSSRHETLSHDPKHLAFALSAQDSDFTKAKQAVVATLESFGVEATFQETSNPSFIEGRVAEVRIDGKNMGIVGEINPIVLEAHGIVMPVAAFEIDLNKFFECI